MINDALLGWPLVLLKEETLFYFFCLDFLRIIYQLCYLDQSAIIDYRFLSQCEKVITFQPFVHVSWQT